jgi:hypothetical protein
MAEHHAVLSWWEPTGVTTATVLTPDIAENLLALGVESQEATLGNRSENIHRAIGWYTAALRVHTEKDVPRGWAVTQNNLGTAYQDLPAGDRAANLRMAIACYTAALRVYTEKDFPQDWARAQNNVGTAYQDLPAGDRAANLRMAIACFEAAERGYRKVGMVLKAEHARR